MSLAIPAEEIDWVFVEGGEWERIVRGSFTWDAFEILSQGAQELLDAPRDGPAWQERQPIEGVHYINHGLGYTFEAFCENCGGHRIWVRGEHLVAVRADEHPSGQLAAAPDPPVTS